MYIRRRPPRPGSRLSRVTAKVSGYRGRGILDFIARDVLSATKHRFSARRLDRPSDSGFFQHCCLPLTRLFLSGRTTKWPERGREREKLVDGRAAAVPLIKDLKWMMIRARGWRAEAPGHAYAPSAFAPTPRFPSGLRNAIPIRTAHFILGSVPKLYSINSE